VTVTVDQLRNLTDRAGTGLTPDEQARLRDGINRLEHAETALARIRALADEHPAGIDTALIHAELPDRPADDTTPAEVGVSRVNALYERWVKAGPPPLGSSINRWWDRRLAELGAAVNPAKEQ